MKRTRGIRNLSKAQFFYLTGARLFVIVALIMSKTSNQPSLIRANSKLAARQESNPFPSSDKLGPQASGVYPVKRTIGLSIAAALLGFAFVASAQWSDNFDSYPGNANINGLGGWKGWDNSPNQAPRTSTALSLSAPDKVRFRYRLLDFDTGWRDAGSFTNGALLDITCPRCESPVQERFYGPCASCRSELRATLYAAAGIPEAEEDTP